MRLPTAALMVAAVLGASSAPVGQRSVTLPDIDTSTSPNGIVLLPDDVPQVFRDVFVRYTKVVAPNGRPIHILAQDGWSEARILKARNVLEHILTDAPGTLYGADKSIVANAMADNRATLTLFNTEPDMHEAFRGGLRRVDLGMQDLRANESPVEGHPDYMAHRTRDASFEEVLHSEEPAFVIGSGTIALATIWALRATGFQGSILAQAKREHEQKLARTLGASDVVAPGPEARQALVDSGASA